MSGYLKGSEKVELEQTRGDTLFAARGTPERRRGVGMQEERAAKFTVRVRVC